MTVSRLNFASPPLDVLGEPRALPFAALGCFGPYATSSGRSDRWPSTRKHVSLYCHPISRGGGACCRVPYIGGKSSVGAVAWAQHAQQEMAWPFCQSVQGGCR